MRRQIKIPKKRIPANNWAELQPLSSDKRAKDFKIKTKLLNLGWVIGILIALLILFISFIFYDNRILQGEKVIGFISTAALILSIILSVMAIQYTYTSNSQIDRRFDDINKAAAYITEVARDITQTNIKLDNNLDLILGKLDNIDKAMAGYIQTSPDLQDNFSGNKITAGNEKQGINNE